MKTFPLLFTFFTIFAVSLPFTSAKLVFYESFENTQTITQNSGTFADISFTSGLNGTAVFINSSSLLSYPAEENLNFTSGRIDFWFRPNWSGDDDKIHYFFSWKSGKSVFRIFKHYSRSSGKSYFVFRADGSDGNWKEASTSGSEPDIVMKWKSGEWHHVNVMWNFNGENQFLLLLLDNFSRISYYNWTFSEGPESFFVGSYPQTTLFNAESAIDDLRIYDSCPYDPENPPTIINITKGDGECQPYETIYNSEGDCHTLSDTVYPDKPLLFFQTPPFFPVFEGTVPQENSITCTLSYNISRNEFGPLFFNIYTRKNLNSLRISVTDFIGNSDTIPKENADLRVVKNWFQAGTGPTKTTFAQYVPELLLHNDTVHLENLYWNSSLLPSLPHLDHVYTTMKAHTSKQFVVILKVPSNITPGTYNATVVLQDPAIPYTVFNITLNVLPITLPRPQKKIIIYYQGKLTQRWDDSVSPQRLDAQIKDISEHGFNGICLYKEYGENAMLYQQQKLSTAKKYGIDKMAIFIDFEPELKQLLEENGYEPYFYGVDEPNSDEKLVAHIQKSKTIHEGGGKVITAIQKATADRLEDPDDPIYENFTEGTYEPLDIANLATGSKYSDYYHSLINGSFVRTRNETYYWQIMQEDPRINRFMSGFFLWNTNLDGIFPYVYQSVRGNPYNDFDIWSQRNPYYRDHVVTYPSIEGPVPTIQWEALREGIDDLRYLTLWKNLTERISRYNTSLANHTRQKINSVLEKYKNYSNMMQIPISQYTADRNTIISEILLLQQAPLIKADTNCNGKLDSSELLSFIQKWKGSMNYTIRELISIISFWKRG